MTTKKGRFDVLDENPIDRLTSAVAYLRDEHPSMERLAFVLPGIGRFEVIFEPKPPRAPFADALPAIEDPQ